MRKYKSESWLDSRVEVRSSSLGGKGLFAKKPIKKEEKVIVFGGIVLTEKEIAKGEYQKGSSVEIGEGLYIAGKPGEADNVDFLNHSCNPNLWLKDEVTLIAKYDIKKDEELTADYATWISRPYWKMECNCKSKFCRKIITGNDWELKDLQKRYRNHFSPYLNKRIKN